MIVITYSLINWIKDVIFRIITNLNYNTIYQDCGHIDCKLVNKIGTLGKNNWRSLQTDKQ